MTNRFLPLLLLCAVAHATDRPGMADWERGVALYRDEEYRKAQDLFKQAVSEDPDSSRFHLWLGLAIGRRAEQMSGLRRLSAMSLAKQVRVEFETAVELDPTNLEALDAFQGFHLTAPGIVGGDKARARSIAGRIEKIDPAWGAAAWAAYHEDVGDFGKAGEYHARARELAPDEIRYLLAHAGFLSRQGQQAESDRWFDAAFDREPDNPDVWLAAARAWIKAKRRSRYPRARELLERYIDSPERRLNSDPPSLVRKLSKQL